jgi:hypothetical protein
MAARRPLAPFLADTYDMPRVGGPETTVLFLHGAPGLHGLGAKRD